MTINYATLILSDYMLRRNMKKLLKIVFGLVVIGFFLFFVRTYYSGNKQELQPINQIESVLFTQYVYPNEVTVSNYSVDQKQITNVASYQLPSPLHVADAYQEPPVLYDKNGNMYVIVQNYDDMGGEIINEEYPSKVLVAKANLQDRTLDVVYMTDDYVSQWAIDPEKEVIYLYGQVEMGSWRLEKVDLLTGKSELIMSYQDGQYKNEIYHPIVLSNDGKHLYQTVDTWVEPQRKIVLRMIDLDTKSLEDIDVFTGSSLDVKTTVSPDNKYLAFKSEGSIYFYDIGKRVITGKCQVTGKTYNTHLTWTGDSENILTLHEDGIQSCSVNSKESRYIVSTVKPYTLGNTQPYNYALYQIKDMNNIQIEQWSMYDFDTGEALPIAPLDESAEVVGISWR